MNLGKKERGGGGGGGGGGRGGGRSGLSLFAQSPNQLMGEMDTFSQPFFNDQTLQNWASVETNAHFSNLCFSLFQEMYDTTSCISFIS